MRHPIRDAGGGGARAPPKFGILVNPIWTKGGRLCPPYYYVPPHLFGQCGISGKMKGNDTTFYSSMEPVHP